MVCLLLSGQGWLMSTQIQEINNHLAPIGASVDATDCISILVTHIIPEAKTSIPVWVFYFGNFKSNTLHLNLVNKSQRSRKGEKHYCYWKHTLTWSVQVDTTSHHIIVSSFFHIESAWCVASICFKSFKIRDTRVPLPDVSCYKCCDTSQQLFSKQVLLCLCQIRSSSTLDSHIEWITMRICKRSIYQSTGHTTFHSLTYFIYFQVMNICQWIGIAHSWTREAI